MAISRRQVIKLGQALVVAAAVPKGVFAADAEPDPLAGMSRTRFERLIGTTFTTNASSMQPTWLTLNVVEDLNGTPAVSSSLATEAFALHFAGVGAALKEGIYQFDNSAVGAIWLFVTPANEEYLAVVNHLLSPLPKGQQIPAPNLKPGPA